MRIARSQRRDLGVEGVRGRAAVASGQRAEPLHRAGDVVQRARFADEHRNAEAPDRLDHAGRKSAAPDDDQVGTQRRDAFEVDAVSAGDARNGPRLRRKIRVLGRADDLPPAPIANSCSVGCGARLTMRAAGAGSVTVAPSSSTTVTAAAAPGVAGRQHQRDQRPRRAAQRHHGRARRPPAQAR